MSYVACTDAPFPCSNAASALPPTADLLVFTDGVRNVLTNVLALVHGVSNRARLYGSREVGHFR